MGGSDIVDDIGYMSQITKKLQINAYICKEEREKFETYAHSHSLDVAALLTLLLVREIKIHQFKVLKEFDYPPNSPKDAKVTVHGRELGLHASVKSLATTHGTSVSDICATLIRAELRDRWLEKALVTRIESR